MINSVRNTVLAILNKNNYGYISPSDFNQYAKQAQMEFFDEYFSSYNKAINGENARLSGTDYADIRKTLMEVLENFLVTKQLTPFDYDNTDVTRNRFYMPSLTTTGDEAYMINTIVCYPNVITEGTNDGVQTSQLIDSTATFVGSVNPGDFVINWNTLDTAIVYSVIDDATLYISADIFQNLGDEYYIISAQSYKEAEKINTAKVAMLNSSNLTAPSSLFPVYTLEGQIIQVFPISSTFTIGKLGQLQAQYFRYPKEPKWTYVTLSGGEPVFDQSQPDYQDFELPQEDEYKLVVKILEYCGISIREAEVVQFGMAQEQHEQPTFSQKQ